MSASRQQLRISGLVRASNKIRAALAAGIPPEQAEAFRKSVRDTLAQTEAICREHRLQPQDLPAPSYRAYRYLKELDLSKLPAPATQASAAPKPPRVQITNIVVAQSTMNATFTEWLSQPQQRAEKLTADHPQVQAYVRMLNQHVSEIERLAQEQGGTPGHLPTRSLRAYQWLKFLSDPATLAAHLEMVRAVLREFHQPRCPKRLSPAPPPPAEVAFAYSTHLYRAMRDQTGLRVTLHEGLLGASPEVWRAVVCAILRQEKAYQHIVQEFGASEEFLEIVAALEMTTAPVEDVTRGRCHDLEQVFERVNRDYFQGQMPRPKLTWSRTHTHVRMGHYDRLRDLVMLSVALDAPHVPEYVVDFVMYHELLHKQLGIAIANGRRYAHTPEFRAAERRFRRYAEAQAFLKTPGKT